MGAEVVRLAVWSGPRNISTAMMRSWENREDSVVVDEPLYAYYLAKTGLDHPMREEVVAAGETDAEKVIEQLLGPTSDDVRIFYQKHMMHHLLPELDREWIRRLRNVLLIRDPREVVASYIRNRANVVPDDIGIVQQAVLYEELINDGKAAPVIDASDFLRNPEGYLRVLCEWLGVEYSPRMLSWPAGPRESDGIWAPHWYAKVHESTGFEPYRPRNPELTGSAAVVAEACMESYERLHAARLLV